MEKVRVAEARRPEAIGRDVCVQGWVRTRRDSKGGFSFLEINDGSSLGNLQVVADGSLANYETEVKRLSPGCSVSVSTPTKRAAMYAPGRMSLPPVSRCPVPMRSRRLDAS